MGVLSFCRNNACPTVRIGTSLKGRTLCLVTASGVLVAAKATSAARSLYLAWPTRSQPEVRGTKRGPEEEGCEPWWWCSAMDVVVEVVVGVVMADMVVAKEDVVDIELATRGINRLR